MVRALLALAFAGGLLACEDWDALVCARRGQAADGGACAGGSIDAGQCPVPVLDGGACTTALFLPQTDFPLTGGAELVRLVLGDTSQVLAFRDQVVTVDAQGPSTFPFDAGALDVQAYPARFWLGAPSGQVWSWTEGNAPQTADVKPVLPFPLAAVVAYPEDDGGTTAAFFGNQGAALTVTAVSEGGALSGSVLQPCAVEGPQTASTRRLAGGALEPVLVVAGISPSCALSAGGVVTKRYVATLWPRGLANPTVLLVSDEPSPTRLRLSGREALATVAYEAEGAIGVVYLDGTGEVARGRSVVLNARGVLEDVGVFGDEGNFVYALTNRTASALEVTATGPNERPQQLAAGATLLVFGRWDNSQTPVVTQRQVLASARPFSGLRFGLDRAGASMWLAAVCPAGATTGPYCPTAQAQVTLLRWSPPPQ
jgi:hypothetical protein